MSTTPIDPDEPPLIMPEPEREPRPHRRGCGCLVLGLLLLAGAVAWWWYSREGAPEGEGPRPEVPVVPAKVERKDLPIYLEGLGTVEASESVTLQVRVEGQITKLLFKEGDDVRQGDLLVEIDPKSLEAELAESAAKVEQDAARFDNARRDLVRYYDMYCRKVISQQQYDTQVALVDELEAAVIAARAAVENRRVQLGYTRVHAPISGRVGLRLIDQGNIARPSDTGGIIVINRLKPISLIFTLPERQIYPVQQQMRKGGVRVDAIDRDLREGSIARGKLEVIDNRIDTSTGTIRMKAEFPNDDLRLWPGQFVNARLLLETKENALVVPSAVIQRGPEGNYVFVIRGNGTAEVRQVEVSMVQLGQAVISKGLEPGEQVVLEGHYRLQEGTPVRIVSESGGVK